MPRSFVPAVDNTATQHEATGHLAINNTFLRRVFTLLALRTTARLYRYDGPRVPISKSLIVKTGPYVHLTEAATMKFIGIKTSIPVPNVYCSFIHRNRAFIVMERIQGQPLSKVWKSLSDTDRESILTQLRDMMRELRALQPPPGTGLESCMVGSLRDSRIARSRPRFGVQNDSRVPHLARDDLRSEEHTNRQDDQDWKDIKDMVSKQDGLWPPPVFSHGDLNPFNIFVYGNRVVSIVDGEFAGWYPCYWEHTSAWCGNLTRQAWQESITKFLDPYPAELKMETIRQKWWGDL
jgi:aminoglycoside phosphotransferase